MSDHITSERPSLDEFRDAMLALAPGSFGDRFGPNGQILEMVADAVVAGRLVFAGHITEQKLFKQAAEFPERLPALSAITPFVFSMMVGGAEQPMLLLARPNPRPGHQSTILLTAVRDAEGRFKLTDASKLFSRIPHFDDMATVLSATLRYLLTCEAAVTTAISIEETTNRSVEFSLLDVAKAIRLKEAEKATAAPAAPTDGGRPLTLGEARQALTAFDELDYRRLGAGGPDLSFVLDAAKQAKAGRLFVIETLSLNPDPSRMGDVEDALKSGALRAPFPSTFILAIREGLSGACLLGVFDNGFVDDKTQGFGLRFGFAFPVRLDDGAIGWRGPPQDAADEATLLVQELTRTVALFVLSLIADSRSSVTRVEADAALNKARIKRGKTAIPPYWKVEAGPTVLVPDVAPKPATAKGGTHASPRPHDRRGHPRNLKSGRTVWVRDCKINALIPHLTRTRSFYEVKL